MTQDQDEVLEALGEVIAALERNAERVATMKERAEMIRMERGTGASYRTIVENEDGPLIVEMLRENQERLARAGAKFRVAEARALRADGLTLDEIARLFGVTRQRVIAILRRGDKVS